MYVVSLPFDLEAIVLMSLSFTGFLGFSVLVTITFRLASALLYKEHSVRNRLSLISFSFCFIYPIPSCPFLQNLSIGSSKPSLLSVFLCRGFRLTYFPPVSYVFPS